MRNILIFSFCLIFISTNSSLSASKSFYKCNDSNFKNFEIINSTPIKVKFYNLEMIAKLSEHNTGQKTYEWGAVYVKEKEQIRYFYIIGENRLLAFQVNLTDKEIDSLIKASKNDTTGEELEKMKSKIFYEKYRDEKINELGEIKCKKK